MPLASIFSGSPFKLALQLCLCFILLFSITGTTLVQNTTSVLEDNVRSRLLEEFTLFSNIYEHEGKEGLVNAVQELSSHSQFVEQHVGVFDADRSYLAGEISLLPNIIGFGTTTLSLTDASPSDQYHSEIFHAGSLAIVIGRSTAGIDQLEQHLITGLIIAGFLLSAGILIAGYLFSYRSYRKLQLMSYALQDISTGNFKTRIPVAPKADQIDLIAIQINQHLDNLARLVAGMQSTVTAIAHDLKTPLSHAQIALFEASDLNENNKDSGDKIGLASQKLEELNRTFDTILRISRLKLKGQDDRLFSTVDLNSLVRNVLELLEPEAQKNSLQLTTDLAIAPPLIECDQGMIQQLLINLIVNCFTHCHAGCQIAIQTRQNDQQVSLHIRDNGPGIPDEKLEYVLEPFARLSQSRTEPGNGLGLALVKAIVDQHQGQLELANLRPGLGVTITFLKR
ncbi:ATP-binding protein [Endozoicomonadaceae bacterium StTr2]